jgi:CHAT domain-containing protein
MKILSLVTITLLVCIPLLSSERVDTLEDNKFYGAANTVRACEKIRSINSKEDISKVEKLFKEGESAWLNSKYKDLNIINQTASQVYYFELIDNVIMYMQKTKQSYLAIPYIMKGMEISYDYVFLNKYIEYATTLNNLYIDLGLFNKSWEHLKKVASIMDELYEYESFDESKSSFETLNAHFTQLKLKMDTVIASENLSLLSYKKLKQEFLNLQQAYKIHPRLQFLDFRYITPTTMLNTKDLTKEELEQSYYYMNIYILKNFLMLFNMYGDRDNSIKILKILNDHYLANIAFKYNAKISAKISTQNKILYGGFFDAFIIPNDGTEEKIEASLLRFPLQNELWININAIELYLLKNENDKALSKLNEAQKAMNNLLTNYAKLEPFYKDIDNIHKDIYRYKMLRATVFERTNKLNDAYNIYKNIINENEELRKTIPLNMRKNFFNGFGKNAYLGLIRINTRIYETNPSTENFKNILHAINNIQARQLKELTNENIDNYTSLKTMQKNLNDSELVYILFDVEDAIVIASISKHQENAKLFIKPNGFDNLLIDFKDKLVKEYQYDFKEMQTISVSLFEQLKKYKTISKLHILSDGLISILPFDIYLDSNNKMLFQNYIIDYLSTLNISTKQYNLKEEEKTFLGIADPNYQNSNSNSNLSEYFIALPETRDEVQQISLSFKKRKLLFGDNAKESILKSMQLEKYNFIHFATHGILGGELRDINEPALVLSPEATEDGLLSASEVAKLKLNAEITVLSACNTGNGKYFRGEGLSGIGRAFKIAGSKNLLVSLWPVDSLATQKLMEKFYQNLQSGEDYSLALHNAKQYLQKSLYKEGNIQRGLKLKTKSNIINKLDSYTNPYFWSAFILMK